MDTTHRIHVIIKPGVDGAKFLPFGKKTVQWLYDQSVRQKLKNLVRRFHFVSDGVSLTTRVDGEELYVIIAPLGCPPVTDGFIDISDFLKPVVEIPDPNAPGNTINALRRFYPSIAEAAARGIPRGWLDEPSLTVSGPATQNLKASQFSGEMRKVVQTLQGMNEFVTYSPTFFKTHGVFTSAGGAKWIISIGVGGVLAYPMRVCNGTTIGDLGYTPLLTPELAGDDLEEAIAQGNYVRLLTALQMQEFYDLVPFSVWCGWAFNANGHQAANVGWRNVNVVRQSAMYRIHIVETGDRPVSATLVKVDEGVIHGPKTTHMKYPDVDGRLYSYDPFYGNTIFSDVCDAPVYVYYDGMNEVVARYKYTPATQNFTIPSTFPPCRSLADNGVTYELDSTKSLTKEPYITLGTLEGPSESYVHTRGFRRTIYYSGPVGYGTVLITNSDVYTGDVEILEGLWGTSLAEMYDTHIVEIHDPITETVTDVSSVLIVPMWDREAAYLYSAFTFDVSAHLETTEDVVSAADVYNTEILAGCLDISGIAIEGHVTGLFEGAAMCNGLAEVFPFNNANIGYIRGYDGGSLKTRYQVDEAGNPNPGNCHSLQGSSFGLTTTFVGNTTTFTHDVPEHTETTFKLRYMASDGVMVDLGVPDAPQIWGRFIDSFSDQRVISIRDAFDGRKYILSPEVNFVRGSDVLSAAQDYPVNEAGSAMAFVGVP